MGINKKVRRDRENEELYEITSLSRTPIKNVWKIVWCVCASFMSIPFGLMLGWPSPVYPRLIAPTSPIPISMDQSALITGFLMIGNLLGAPFSTSTFVKSKYGIILSTSLMTSGWFVMWKARDFYWLLASRLLIGFGNGYGVGQLKIYIKDMCQANISVLLVKQINLYSFFGLLLAFAFGPFVDFRNISVISLTINIFVLFLTILLPSTHSGKIKANKIENTRILLTTHNSHVIVSSEKNNMTNIKKSITKCCFGRIIKNRVLRINFVILIFLVFFQQFSGAPATLVYTQILFERSLLSYPVYFSILYAALFFISNIIGIFISPKFNKKTVLLFSSLSVSLAIIMNICILYFKVNETYFSYSSIIVMSLYITVHTIGLGNIPLTLISDLFPTDCHSFVTIVFIIFHCSFAIIITKLFQVLIDTFDLCVPFYLFLFISLLAFFFVLIFVPKNKKSEILVCS